MSARQPPPAPRLISGHQIRSHKIGLVWIVGLTYLGLVLIATWQALKGQPLLKPDTLTLTVLAVTLLAAAATIIVHSKLRIRN